MILPGQRGDVDSPGRSADLRANRPHLPLVLDREVGEAVVEVAEAQQRRLQRLRLEDEVEHAVGEVRDDGHGRTLGHSLVTMRPDDDDVVPILDALRWQHEYVRATGSTTAALILEAVARDIATGGVLGDLVPAAQRFGDLPGAAHHGGGAPPRARPRGAGRRAMAAHPRAARRPPRRPTRRPSGATSSRRWLATRARSLDSLGADAADQRDGPRRAAAVRAEPAGSRPPRPAARDRCVRGTQPARRPPAGAAGSRERERCRSILDRIGCDLNPVDVATPEGRALLGSYVWVDDVERFRRLAHAMAVAGTRARDGGADGRRRLRRGPGA